MNNPYDRQEGGDHYKGMAIQPMQFSMANGLDACTHTAIKYLVRKKGDKDKRAEDLRKAIHCIQLLAQHEGIELGEAVQPAAVPYFGPDRRKAVEPAATIKESSTVADADGWIKWDGGVCPVNAVTRVDLQFLSGDVAEACRPLNWKWEHCAAPLPHDIIAYRPSKKASHV